jgi:ParB family chromosome partitioning protein
MAKAIKKQALGRGLSALLNDEGAAHSSAAKSPASFVILSLDQIKVNPYQPRTRFSETALKELENSIKSLGLIQPITVRETDQGHYELVSGERRYRASKNIGLQSIPAYIRSANDQELLEMALVENIQRQDLDPIEIALTYQRLLEDVSLSISELGDRLGKDRTTVTNYLRLLKLDPLIQSGMRDGFISMGHGRSLINIEDIDNQLAIYEEILDKKLSVRQTEERVKALKEGKTAASKTSKAKADRDVVLSDILDLPVMLKSNAKGGGMLQIKYKNQRELEALRKKLLGEN